MKLHKNFILFLWVVGCLFLLPADYGWASSKPSFTVTDFRGKDIEIPEKVNRVITISDGMVEGVMTRLGQAHKIVGLGSACLPKVWEYNIPGHNGKTYSFKNGMNPVTHINLGFKALPLVTRSGVGISYEKVAELDPDLIIIRTGSCSLSQSCDVLKKNIELLESLGIPLIVLHGPNTLDKPEISSISREIILLGQVFRKEEVARKLANYLESCVEFVRKRTAGIPVESRKKLLLLGLSPKARSQGGAAHVKGNDTLQSFFLDKIINADNAYEASGAWNILSTEQVLSHDPDVIVLVTAWGYHPPEELYEAPYYKGLSQMRAVKNKMATALPWTPCNCEKRLEYPIDIMVMAKAAYPELFSDIKLSTWLISFYQKVYKVDLKTADELISRQWMDWTRKE
ncbi:MAG: ABC transporter substrate-binding protein [Desulfobacterales bacterium]|nr:ABC transporter substrate-binding protein [Desulfobacterales bacterium]